MHLSSFLKGSCENFFFFAQSMVDPVIASKKAVLLTCAIPEVKRGCPVSALHKSEAISLSLFFFFVLLPSIGGGGAVQVK